MHVFLFLICAFCYLPLSFFPVLGNLPGVPGLPNLLSQKTH